MSRETSPWRAEGRRGRKIKLQRKGMEGGGHEKGTAGFTGESKGSEYRGVESSLLIWPERTGIGELGGASRNGGRTLSGLPKINKRRRSRTTHISTS